MRFGLRPDEEQNPAIQPPLWSVLVYMLLVETLDVSDKTLIQRFGLVPLGDPTPLDSGLKTDAQGRMDSGKPIDKGEAHSGTLTEVGNLSFSSFAYCNNEFLQAPESMTVQCLNAYPMELTLVDAPTPHRAKKQYHPIIYLDRHLGAGWSSVYSSSKSHVVVKFAAAPNKDKATLKRQLTNEKMAYNKLSRITGWIVPRLYGEYEWHGGRALVLSDEGRSLSHLGEFKSLLLIERYGMPIMKRIMLIFCTADLSYLRRCTASTGWESSTQTLSPRMCCERSGPVFSRSLTLGSQMSTIHVQVGGSVAS